ncbi:MAG: redoxin domain-containing protein [Deltaproteobacteria bacterium]|jgi:thiol-disulfide isomerase/thioredoxin|nr:redoxin domain-containing protein [Deltaproteobacteria bacterium]MBW2530880.1 redoxin domain-containing protein [Deltaproteobacteria bacterium]
MPSCRPRRPTTVALAALLALAAATGCEGDCSFADDVVAGHGANPEGVPYPDGPYGAVARSDATPGDVFPNLGFPGYPAGAADGEMATISLADYFDPQMRRFKVLHLTAVAMWCPYCAREASQLAEVAPALGAEGAAFVQVIIDGPDRGESPDRCDLDDWIDEYDLRFAVALDAQARRLGSVAALQGVPYNAIIDTRTMEVLDTGTGAPDDVAAAVRHWIEWVDTHP